jgi:hypothetical protein
MKLTAQLCLTAAFALLAALSAAETADAGSHRGFATSKSFSHGKNFSNHGYRYGYGHFPRAQRGFYHTGHKGGFGGYNYGPYRGFSVGTKNFHYHSFGKR